MKICLQCTLPRPDSESACAICGCQEFSAFLESVLSGMTVQALLDGRFGDAYRDLETLVAAGEQTASRCLTLAWLAWTFDDHRAVEIWAHEAMRLDDRSLQPHLLMGIVFMHMQRWSEAVEEFDAALRRCPPGSSQAARLQLHRDKSLAHIPEFD